MKNLIKSWSEDLIWCPSQIESNRFRFKNNSYCVYLRWRWDNPWEATLIKMGKAQSLIDGEWSDIEIPFFNDEQYKELEKWIEVNINNILNKDSDENNFSQKRR